MEILFFSSSPKFHSWFEENHHKVSELWVGFHKKASGKPSITYREALDEALCFGWIDGVRRSFGHTSYAIRFTPRKGRSNWSLVNIQRAGELEKLGRLREPGLRAFHQRDEKKSRLYSYERQTRTLDPAYEKKFQANRRAWNFFQAQPPYYRRTATGWVISAKQEQTRLRRLETLIQDSENGMRIAVIAPKKAAAK